MLRHATTPTQQGNIGMGCAIAWYAAHCWTVCVPLTDSQKYDLIVEKDGEIRRVQVKTSRSRAGNGYQVALRTARGDREGASFEKFDNAKADDLFILTDDGATYRIPTQSLTAKSYLSLPGPYGQYRVEMPRADALMTNQAVSNTATEASAGAPLPSGATRARHPEERP